MPASTVAKLVCFSCTGCTGVWDEVYSVCFFACCAKVAKHNISLKGIEEMSTRWYPLYQRGNPQLRVFLPNFWMKLVKPMVKSPPNVVQFHCSMEMTRYDVKNYLEKIYDVKTVHVRTRIQMGRIKKHPVMQCVVKEDDVKVAYAILDKNEHFEFPALIDEEAQKKDKKFDDESQEDMKAGYIKFLKANNKPGAPGWFSI